MRGSIANVRLDNFFQNCFSLHEKDGLKIDFELKVIVPTGAAVEVYQFEFRVLRMIFLNLEERGDGFSASLSANLSTDRPDRPVVLASCNPIQFDLSEINATILLTSANLQEYLVQDINGRQVVYTTSQRWTTFLTLQTVNQSNMETITSKLQNITVATGTEQPPGGTINIATIASNVMYAARHSRMRCMNRKQAAVSPILMLMNKKVHFRR